MEQANTQQGGILGTAPVHDFSGTLFPAPKITNFGVLAKNIRELGEDSKLDDTEEFAARARAFSDQFAQETTAVNDFIEEDRDFSNVQITGNQAAFTRLRAREAATIDSAFDRAQGLVVARENKRLIEEEREHQKELLEEKTRLELQLTAAQIGISNPAGLKKKDLINAIAKRSGEDIAFSRRKSTPIITPNINSEKPEARTSAYDTLREQWLSSTNGGTQSIAPNQSSIPVQSPVIDYGGYGIN